MNAYEIIKTNNTNIPTELLMKIVSHLSPQEKQIGLLICKDWYEVFRHGLYSNISLKNISNLEILFDSLIYSQKNNTICNGQLIKQLSIQNNKLSLLYVQDKALNDKQCIITESLFERLPDVCPNLEVLDFDPEAWKTAVYHDNIERWRNMRQLPTLCNMGTSLPYLEQLGDNLMTLSIQSNMLVSISTQSALTSILSMVPRIKKLVIQGGDEKTTLNLTVQDIEVIHKQLPSLESLEITGDNIHLILGVTDLDKFPTVPNFRSLHLDTGLTTPAWTYYIAHKYPQLQQLTLNIHFDENHWDTFLEESIQAEKSLFLYLVRKCHHLEVISLSCPIVDHWLNRSFFECLKKNNSVIRQISPIVKRNNQIKFDSDFTTALEFGKDLITALEIEQWRFDTKLHSTVNFLSNFTQLSYLNIVCDSYNGEYNMDKILDNCPLLETLVLEWGTMHVPCEQERSIRKQHPLKTLDITFIAFTPSVFRYLSDRCPSLNNLHIYKCKQLCALNDTASQTKLLIDMPHNRFETILINGVRLDLCSASMFVHGISSYIRLASIETSQGTNWYQHIGYNENDRSHPLLEHLGTYDVNRMETYFAKRQACRMPNDQREFLKSLSEQRISDTLRTNLTFGYIKINCKSIENFSLDSYAVCRSQ